MKQDSIENFESHHGAGGDAGIKNVNIDACSRWGTMPATCADVDLERMRSGIRYRPNWSETRFTDPKMPKSV